MCVCVCVIHILWRVSVYKFIPFAHEKMANKNCRKYFRSLFCVTHPSLSLEPFSVGPEMGSLKMGNEYASICACRCALYACSCIFDFWPMKISALFAAWKFPAFITLFPRKQISNSFFFSLSRLFTVSPESIVIPIVSCIFGFPLLALLVICCLRHRAKMARERDRRRNYDLQDHAVSLVRFSPIHRLSESTIKTHPLNWFFQIIILIYNFIGVFSMLDLLLFLLVANS